VRRLILTDTQQSGVTTSSRDRAVWRLCAALAVVGSVVLLVGVSLGIAAPGASSPLDGPASGTEDDSAHQNPADLGERADLGSLERELRSAVASQTEAGALNLTQENYERAREQLGDDTLDQLVEEYQDVAAETGSDNRSAAVSRSQAALVNVSDRVGAYWDAHRAYDRLTGPGPQFEDLDFVAARQSPETVLAEFNATTTRELVAELEQRAERVNESAAVAVEQYRELSATTGTNYSATVAGIRSSRDSIAETQRGIRETWYTRTNLTLRVESTNVSAVEPLVVRGQLTTADGALFGGRRLNVSVGEQYVTARTNTTGWFTLQYRPTQLAANTTELVIGYEPPPGSEYLGSEQTVNVTVQRVRPAVTVGPSVDVARFNETVTVTGRVGTADAAFPGVPYILTVDGQFVAREETTAAGQIETAFSLPETIEPGDRQVRARLPTEGRALLPANATAEIRVESSPTVLSFDAEPTEQGAVRVDGTLRTDGGVPVANRSVQLRIDDSAAGTAVTDANGTFGATLSVPEGSGGDADTAVVEAVFDGAGTNLESTSRSTGVAVTNPSQQVEIGTPGTETSVGLAVAGSLLAVVAGGSLLYWYRRRDHAGEGDSDGGDPVAATAPASNRAAVAEQVERAGELLEAGRPEAAVRAGYAALRRGLSGDETSRIQTHWEFYEHQRDRLDAETAGRLRQVTEAYERVAFAGESADSSTAREVVDAVRSLEGSEPDGDAARPASD
jgi:hypothetical protein